MMVLRFGENNLFMQKYIDIHYTYINFEDGQAGILGLS